MTESKRQNAQSDLDSQASTGTLPPKQSHNNSNHNDIMTPPSNSLANSIKFVYTHLQSPTLISRVQTLAQTHSCTCQAEETHILDMSSVQRFLHIRGPIENIASMIPAVIPILQNSCTENTHSLIKIMVSGSAAGCIIGRGGHNVKELQKTLQCKILILKETYTTAKLRERICVFEGVSDKVKKAVTHVFNMLAYTAPRPALIHMHEHKEYPSNTAPMQDYSRPYDNDTLLTWGVTSVINNRPYSMRFPCAIDMAVPIHMYAVLSQTQNVITQIQIESGAYVQCKSDPELNSFRISIVGPLAACITAQVLVAEYYISMINAPTAYTDQYNYNAYQFMHSQRPYHYAETYEGDKRSASDGSFRG